ncbi:unnamed protein product [Polarella glacialis]|uniref:SUN domain-containing protein n=1 Tax=Polarella glacialis TaxID=89957 RepID=A0A813IHB9_POLGL|nr:unnamed protein product [Polarella glacialis]
MEGTARDALAAEEALSDMRQARSKGEVSVSAADAVLPSPLRQRATRSSSPAPVTPFSSAASATRVPRAGEKLELKVNSCDAASRHQDKTEAKQPRRLGLPSGLALLAAAAAMMLWPKLSTRSSSALRSEDLALRSANSSEESRAPATVEVGPEASPSLPALVAHALACPGARADVLDVLAGAPYEFGDGVLQDQAFYRLPRLAAAAAQAVDEAASGRNSAEEDLKKAVLQMAATGGGWPLAFRDRLLATLRGPCDAKSVCAEAEAPLRLEVDESFTSPAALSSGLLHQSLLRVGALTGLPSLRARAELYRSRHSSVVLSPSPAEARSRDCLALRGNGTSLALRLVAGPSHADVVQQLVIEQPPRWAALQPRSLPRHFAVYGEPAEQEATPATGSSRNGSPYSALLGNFEYAAAGPAVQAFPFSKPASVKGLQVVFEGQGWGESYICLYRVRAFKGTGPACSGDRVAFSAKLR